MAIVSIQLISEGQLLLNAKREMTPKMVDEIKEVVAEFVKYAYSSGDLVRKPGQLLYSDYSHASYLTIKGSEADIDALSLVLPKL